MDVIKDATKNINLYDVKAYVRKAQNVAMNLTEMEAKVREATNNEPWGAPSTLMAQIASGTYNYREREEIISFVFRRFTEKAANEWRQIYKSLQLLDYLIRNGSERLIDDIRSNLSLIQMLKSFHYIDSKGRDQGINVRNRAKNLIGLLNDDSLIRAERKKARNNSKKFGGVSSAAFGGASSITNGAGMDDGDFTNRVFGDGGVYGARYGDSADEYNRNNGDSNTNSNENFEEYNVEPTGGSGSSRSKTSRATTGASNVNATSSKAHAKSKPQPQEPDLLGDFLSDNTPGQSQSQAQPDDDDDDFDDFQSAPTNGSSSGTGSNLANLSNLYQSQPQQNFFQAQPQQQQFQPQQQYQPQVQQQALFNNGQPAVNKVQSQPKNDAFSSLFSSAKTKTGGSSRTPSASIPSTTTQTPQATTNNDDFFGDFNSNSNSNKPSTPSQPPANNNNSSNNGEVDLLSF